MTDSNGQFCFLCDESHSKLFYEYTEPVCENCLNFKGHTRIEGIIGNKRRLKKRVHAATDISEGNSTLHHTNAQKTHLIERTCQSKTSLSVGNAAKKHSPQRILATRTKRSASTSPRISRISLNNETDKTQIFGGVKKCPDESTTTDDSLMEYGTSLGSVSEEPVTKICDSKIKIVIKNSLHLVIPLPFGTIQGQTSQDNVQELARRVSQLSASKECGDHRISESVALEAIKALGCNPFCPKASAKAMGTSLNPSSSRDDGLLPLQQSLKRNRSDSRSKVGSKKLSHSFEVISPVVK